MKPLFALSIIAAFTSVAQAGDLSATRECLQRGYKALTNRHAIVAAVLDADNAEILKFGAATEDQLFEIGSITKTFTANLLAQSVSANTLRLSDPIPRAYQKAAGTITFQHLTTHTSGIVGADFPGRKPGIPLAPYNDLTISVFKDLYAQTPLVSQPGASWAYSNIASSLLGMILGEGAGTSYEALVAEKIFKPLGMTDSYFEVPEKELGRFPRGYMTDDSSELLPVPHWDLSGVAPAGGLRSSIGDMVKYARANLAPARSPLADAIKLSHQPLYRIANRTWIGMNWIVEPDDNLVWHDGETYGFNSILAVSRKKGQAVVAMTDTTFLRIDSDGNKDLDGSLETIALDCVR